MRKKNMSNTMCEAYPNKQHGIFPHIFCDALWRFYRDSLCLGLTPLILRAKHLLYHVCYLCRHTSPPWTACGVCERCCVMALYQIFSEGFLALSSYSVLCGALDRLTNHVPSWNLIFTIHFSGKKILTYKQYKLQDQ